MSVFNFLRQMLFEVRIDDLPEFFFETYFRYKQNRQIANLWGVKRAHPFARRPHIIIYEHTKKAGSSQGLRSMAVYRSDEEYRRGLIERVLNGVEIVRFSFGKFDDFVGFAHHLANTPLQNYMGNALETACRTAPTLSALKIEIARNYVAYAKNQNIIRSLYGATEMPLYLKPTQAEVLASYAQRVPNLASRDPYVMMRTSRVLESIILGSSSFLLNQANSALLIDEKKHSTSYSSIQKTEVDLDDMVGLTGGGSHGFF